MSAQYVNRINRMQTIPDRAQANHHYRFQYYYYRSSQVVRARVLHSPAKRRGNGSPRIPSITGVQVSGCPGGHACTLPRNDTRCTLRSRSYYHGIKTALRTRLQIGSVDGRKTCREWTGARGPGWRGKIRARLFRRTQEENTQGFCDFCFFFFFVLF